MVAFSNRIDEFRQAVPVTAAASRGQVDVGVAEARELDGAAIDPETFELDEAEPRRLRNV